MVINFFMVVNFFIPLKHFHFMDKLRAAKSRAANKKMKISFVVITFLNSNQYFYDCMLLSFHVHISE